MPDNLALRMRPRTIDQVSRTTHLVGEGKIIRRMVEANRLSSMILYGPPGIGKTQVMEQVAKECKVALVAYTITHHTRQSAVGLPFMKRSI